MRNTEIESIKSEINNLVINYFVNELYNETNDDAIKYIEDHLNDQIWSITDCVMPEDHIILKIFNNNINDIDNAYVEMCNEIGEGNTEDEGIFEKIKKGVFWYLYIDVYNTLSHDEILSNIKTKETILKEKLENELTKKEKETRRIKQKI